MPNIDSPLQEPHPRHASATIVTTEREYIPPKPPTRNILPRGSPHKRTPIGYRAGGSAVWDRPGLVIVVHHNACAECPRSIHHRRRSLCDTLPVKCHRADYPGARENSDGKVTRPQIDDSGEVRLRHRPLRMI